MARTTLAALVALMALVSKTHADPGQGQGSGSGGQGGSGGGQAALSDCFVPRWGKTGCADKTCEQLICNTFDAGCCDVEWNGNCAYAAQATCASICQGQCSRGTCLATSATDFDCKCNNGYVFDAFGSKHCIPDVNNDCFTTHFGTGCSDGICRTTVINEDPYCETYWDAKCVEIAKAKCIPDVCQGKCARGTCISTTGNNFFCKCKHGYIPDKAAHGKGCIPAGPNNCFDVHLAVGCSDAACSLSVCSVDKYCCSWYWDENCVLRAQELCGGPSARRTAEFGEAARSLAPMPRGYMVPIAVAVPVVVAAAISAAVWMRRSGAAVDSIADPCAELEAVVE